MRLKKFVESFCGIGLVSVLEEVWFDEILYVIVKQVGTRYEFVHSWNHTALGTFGI